MQVATWNVNSVRTRLQAVCSWLERRRPEVLCLQETKVRDEEFPAAAFNEVGYEVWFHGQKTYNGVALVSRVPLSGINRGLAVDGVDDRRVLAATAEGVDIVNVYVPNGSAVGSDKFAYKLRWLDALAGWLAGRCHASRPLVLCGDFNIAPQDRDVHDPDLWRGQVLFHADEHAALARLLGWGLQDALRLHHQEGGIYTWWDYRAAAFRRDRGLRIDLILLTESLSRRCTGVSVDREERAGERPSDHVPVTANFS